MYFSLDFIVSIGGNLMVDFQANSSHTWISFLSFFICIIFVILSPELPIPLPTLKFLQSIWKKKKNNENEESFQQEIKDVEINHEEIKSIESIQKEDIPSEILLNNQNIQTISESFQENEGTIQSSTNETPKKYWFYKFPIDMGSIPIIILILLFCFTTLNITIFLKGIIGDEFIQPYSIIILFMSLSYVCISLDVTGIFEFLANWIIQKSNNKGHRIYLGLCLFSSILTVFTSNDIVILTLTPITTYMAKSSKNMDAFPFVLSQFFLANIWSIALEVGNPTNVIVAEAYKLGFIKYFIWMCIPAIVAGCTCFGILYAIFYKSIPDIIEQIDSNTEKKEIIKSKWCAIVKTVGLLLCLVIFAVNSTIPNNPIKLWIICLVFGCIYLIFDIIYDIYNYVKFKSSPLLKEIVKRVPWKIPSFVVGMFVIVELLKTYGWISLFSIIYSNFVLWISGGSDSTIGIIWGIFSSSIIMGFVSAFACNILNNQPMTILFTNMINESTFKMSSIMKFGSTLALIIGSNLGANITLIGALAGIMWNGILKQNGISVGYFKFLLYGIIITPIVILASTSTLSIELVIYQFSFDQNNTTLVNYLT